MGVKKITMCYLYLLSLLFTNGFKAQESNIVIDGKARFTVLTPTLIRTEYSGDGIFEDRNSFNIVNHNLPAPAYTTTINDGWREIETEKISLRYKQNSGAFSTNNLIADLKGEDEPIVAKPWNLPVSAYTQEAESARLFGGAARASNHTGYRGSGFVAGLKKVGAGIEWNVRKYWEPGEYIVQLRYSNGMESDRTISLYVDNVKKEQITFEQTTDWKEWKMVQTKVTLDFAPHSFKIVGDEGDNYNINIDWINIIPVAKINRICEAEHAILAEGAAVDTEHHGYSGSGFVAKLTKTGPNITWELNNDSTAGQYDISIKYANGVPGTGEHIDRTLSLYVNGVKSQITFDRTADWKTWNISKKTISLNAGQNIIRLSCDADNSHRVNIDWIAVTPLDTELPDENLYKESKNLGAWSRGLDEKKGTIPLWDGILSREGWYLLDDSHTALHDGEDWIVDRPVHAGGYQDGYFFGYGTDFQTALKDFYKITGNPVLLPKWAFGIWYSINSGDYTNAYYYQNTLLPNFRSNKVPLDVLVVDTDWRYPERWNSWDWNKTFFPDPQAFFDWTKEMGLVIPLNVHPTIQNSDSRFAVTNATAEGLITNGDNRYHFDFTNKKHAKAYFDLHKPFDDLGTRFWWFDQAEYPNSAIAGAPADTWINNLYAKAAIDRGLRGFAFSRVGSGHMYYDNNRDPGEAWSEHRYTVHFTGDTYNEWNMLAFQSVFTIKEANIGIPYVSHDIGSYHGNHLSDDMYMRWIQFGTFQPIFRLHSKRGERLPWQYPNVKQQAEDFIRLRHALIPYTYTLAHESSTGGLPIVRGMYFYYPEASESYTYDRQYFYGEKVLVSPIVTAGQTASTQVWFPEGRWTNYFTNEIVIGPAVKTVSANYNTMPVFVKAGGIIPLAPYSDNTGQIAGDSLILKVYAGDEGSFTLYEDEGENLNYQAGKYALTTIEYKEQEKKLSIKAQQGSYIGAPERRSYNIEFYNAVVPEKIFVNGIELNNVITDSTEGWQVSNNVIYIHLNKRTVVEDIDIIFGGVSAILPIEHLNKGIKIFPNPATNLFTLELNNIDKESLVSIYNYKGEKVFNKLITNSKEMTINTQTFSKGVYLVKIDDGSYKYTEKFIIK